MKLELKNAVMPLVILNAVFFILQSVLGDSFTYSFVLMKGDLFFRPWTLLTSMFLHGSVTHLFFNMYVLLMFGSLLEQRIGTKRFLFVYFFSGLLASFISSFVYESALGASGAIMGLLGVLIILMPDLRVLFFFVIPMSLRTAAIFFALIDLLGIIPGVAHAAHLAGLSFGLLYGLQLKKQRKSFRKKFSSKLHLNSEDIEDYLKTGRI